MFDDHVADAASSDASAQGAARGGLFRTIAHRLGGARETLPDEGRLPSFDRATSWLNSQPLTPEGLRGRVVLIDFWTYTCINWLRTLPYLKAWAAKYEDAGLTVVGVHTPEFGFERDLRNVMAQSRNLGVDYPIAVDSDYGVWDEFANHYWPAVYVADGEGRLRATISARVSTRDRDGARASPSTPARPDRRLGPGGGRARGLEVAADWRTLRSPETYLGYRQRNGFASEDVAVDDARTSTARPSVAARLVGARRRLDGRAAPRRRTRPAAASPSRSTRATSTSLWGRPRAPRSRSGSSSTAITRRRPRHRCRRRRPRRGLRAAPRPS